MLNAKHTSYHRRAGIPFTDSGRRKRLGSNFPSRLSSVSGKGMHGCSTQHRLPPTAVQYNRDRALCLALAQLPQMLPPSLPDPSTYTPYYCEENIYLLVQHFLHDKVTRDIWDVYAVFISNPSKTVSKIGFETNNQGPGRLRLGALKNEYPIGSSQRNAYGRRMSRIYIFSCFSSPISRRLARVGKAGRTIS